MNLSIRCRVMAVIFCRSVICMFHVCVSLIIFLFSIAGLLALYINLFQQPLMTCQKQHFGYSFSLYRSLGLGHSTIFAPWLSAKCIFRAIKKFFFRGNNYINSFTYKTVRYILNLLQLDINSHYLKEKHDYLIQINYYFEQNFEKLE